MGPSKVFVTHSEGHEHGVRSVLRLAEEALQGVAGRDVVIKVNFVSAHVELCATPVGAVRALLEALSRHRAKAVLIAESPSGGTLREALRNYGYYALREEFDVEFFDLAEDDYEVFEIWDKRLERRVRVRVSKTMLESEYLVSIVRPKTHDTVVVTLTVKNVAVGAILPPDRGLIHQGPKAINLSIAYIAAHMMPKLAVVDGCVGMEGNGPVSGDPRPMGLAIAGTDAVAVDSTTALLMGFDPCSVGYLYYLWKWGYGGMAPNEVMIEGLTDWRKHVVKFRPHSTYARQLAWRLSPEEYEKALRGLELPRRA